MSESFEWNYPDLNWHQFHSLANLLSLRNGGQAEPSSLHDTLLLDDWDPYDNGDGDSASMDTRLARHISDSGHGKLKQKFLDCLAEFTANRKGGTAVACSAMKESEDNVFIWIARNEGFLDVDKPVFDTLGKLLGSLSADNAPQHEALLWDEMVRYHQNRIESNYIPSLRASFKAYDALCTRNDPKMPENSSASDATLRILRTLLFDGNMDDTSTHENHKRLVTASYSVRRTRNVEDTLYTSSSATSKSRSLWLDICMLSRLRVAFQCFKDIALTLPSLQQVNIILVPRPVTPENPSQRPLNLKQTFGILQLDLSPATIKAILSKNWATAKLEREFAKRQKQMPNVHAEVQMLIFLNTNDSSASGLFPYFGCSKLSCFMCDRFIQSYGRLTTRGCHGRLFKPWTVPRVNRLVPHQSERISKALLSVQEEVKKTLMASVEGPIRHERTSVIGGSCVSGGQQEVHSQRQLQINRLRMKAERDRVAEMFKRRAQDTSSERNTLALARDDLEWDCEICETPTRRRCSMCNKDYFCSDSCQEKRSGSHLFTCSKRPLTSADYLWQSLERDLMPQEEEVLEDFGFYNIISRGDRTYLLGLYRGLYLSGKFSAEEVHEWRVGGILAEKIKTFHYGIPENRRGQYFPWFLKNLHILERPMTKDEAQRREIETFYDKARSYLDIEDRDKTGRELKPEAKGTSYNLLAGILLRASPNPIELNFYAFGFVTCCNPGDESMLVALYQLLLTESDGSFFYEFHNSRRGVFQPATFTQFWKAYESGTLIQLMDSKGLKKLRSRLPFLEGFLSVPPAGPRPSVWDLKQFLEINDPIDYPPIPSVDIDYGFANCHSFEESCILMEIYVEVLKTASPLELHQACIAGQLFEFSSDYVRMEELWRPLMSNPYPLGEIGELEPDQEQRYGIGSEAIENPAAFPSLISRLWGFLGYEN